MRNLLIGLCGLVLLAFSPAPSQAGILDIFDDPISLDRGCDRNPCRLNNLTYQRRLVRDRYFKFKIKKTSARYTWRRQRVMVLPPKVVNYDHHAEIDYLHPKGLEREGYVRADSKSYKVVRKAKYQWVTRRVLSRPAKYRVVRKRPHTAIFAEDIVVVDPRCKNQHPGERCW